MKASLRALRQRSDYTHRFNAKVGRYGWLRLTPAYSLKIVDEILDQCDGPMRVLDPFCGTATTALSAAYRGYEAVTMDVNPFLVWFGRVKTMQYAAAVLDSCQYAASTVARLASNRRVDPVKAPAMHNIQRWWSPEALQFLCGLRASIESMTEQNSPERSLLLVAFCRTLIGLSNATFNHQSMSFRDDRQTPLSLDSNMAQLFIEDVRFVLDGAGQNPTGTVRILQCDSRNMATAAQEPFDLIVTSPPYANRMSYIRELRPYMYWTGFLGQAADAGELDWRAIGGTWGSATSRLTDWQRQSDSFHHPLLESALDRIASTGNKSSDILAKYVARYFDDVWHHLRSLVTILNTNSKIHYIVGNSTFYGVLLPVEKLYAAMLERLDFCQIEYRPIRKRNSKKELFEFDVSARRKG